MHKLAKKRSLPFCACINRSNTQCLVTGVIKCKEKENDINQNTCRLVKPFLGKLIDLLYEIYW